MTELEKRGIPTVFFTAAGFERDARRSADTYGLPQLPLAVMRAPFTNQAPEAIRAMVRDCLDQVVESLTRDLAEAAPRKEITIIDEPWLTFEGETLLDALDNMSSTYLKYGWSDGFPLRPPTEREMDRMLSGVSRGALDAVAIVEPGFGIATVQKIAANAVMAGCRPEHLPVVIAAVECLAEPKMHIRQLGISTGPHTPLLVVNGPIAKKIGLNSGRCALGPGALSFANTVIGRAVRLCMMNIGHIYPDVSDMDTIGSPAKYSLCVAENQDASPWPPYHVEKGFDAETSTVTVQFVMGISELYDFASHEPARLIEVFASTAATVGSVATGCWLLGTRTDPRSGAETKEHDFLFICPDHAEVFRRAGWSKQDIRQALHRKARLPFRSLILTREPKAMDVSHPELRWLWDSPDTMLPVLEDEDCYEIAVVGGPAGRGAFFWGGGGPVTKEIQE